MSDADELDRLLQLLRDRPEQRAALRRLLAHDDESDALQRLDGRLEAVERHLETLAGAQARIGEHLEALTARVDALTQRVDALTERLEALADAQTRTEQRLTTLIERVDALADAQTRTQQQVSRLTGHVGELRGDMVERRYRDRAHAYLSAVARRIRPMPLDELDDLLDDAVDQQAISKSEADEVRFADAVVQGLRHSERVVMVVEASAVVDQHDVERAHRRADVLTRAGAPAMAVAAGERFTGEASDRAANLDVWQVVDGRVVEPPNAR